MPENITYPDATVCTARRRTHNSVGRRVILPGDEVGVYDGRVSDYVWIVVLDAVERDGSMRLRVEGCNFYFAASFVRSFRQNHYVPPHGAPEARPFAVECVGPWLVYLYAEDGQYTYPDAKRTFRS